MCELNLNKRARRYLKVEQSVLGTPNSVLRSVLSCWGWGGLPLLVRFSGRFNQPQTGTKRAGFLWSCCPLKQPVEYWGLRILRLSLCFLSGDSGQWGVCHESVEGPGFSQMGHLCLGDRRASEGKGRPREPKGRRKGRDPRGREREGSPWC